MLPVFLLAMLFATSNGTLLCFISKNKLCYSELNIDAVPQQCKADEVIQCLKNTAQECDINNSTNVGAMEKILGIEHMFYDLCKTGSDMNEAILKHKDCVFGKELLDVNLQCFEPFLEALKKYKTTGNTEKDTEANFEISCEYSDFISKCETTSVKEVCGEDALSFQLKIYEHDNKLFDMACNSSPVPFGPLWTVLLQASVILMSLHYFRLKE